MFNDNNRWDELRMQFPVADKFLYFNHAAISPIPLIVKEKINECMHRYCTDGIVCNHEYLETVTKTRQLAAQLINSGASEIAFIKNTTQGIHIAADGLRWERGDNVLIPGNEFPANVYPWLSLAGRGVETRFVPVMNHGLNAEDLERHADKRTRAISVSAVSFINGFRYNLTEIGDYCREKGIVFIVDAIQALGAVEVDVRKSKIDILAADAHKWLLGPQGIGFMFISESVIERLDVSNLGYKSMIREDDYLDYSIRLKPEASRFEEGTLNIFSIVGLHASLELLLSVGIRASEKRILELTETLAGNLSKKGYTLNSSMVHSERSGIISFYHDIITTDTLYDRLFKAGVVCARRGGAVRLSPHVYNNIKDIEGCLNALP